MLGGGAADHYTPHPTHLQIFGFRDYLDGEGGGREPVRVLGGGAADARAEAEEVVPKEPAAKSDSKSEQIFPLKI